MSGRQVARSASSHLAEMVGPAGAKEPTTTVAFAEWARLIPEPKGPLDFDRFPFQRELYSSSGAGREMVVKKAAQVGVSAFCIRWALYWAAVHGLTALYVFPRQRQLRDFSDARIKPLVASSSVLTEFVVHGGVQNNGLKRFGNGYLVLRGSESVPDLQAVDADVLVLDEYDDLVQDNVPDAERRLGASNHGLVRRVGVPSYPDYGVAQQYDRSDRRRWFVRCDRCSLHQPITWANVDTEKLGRVCTGCAKPLDVARGEWVAEFPDRDTLGYHVSRLIVPNADIGQLVRASTEPEEARRQAFANKDLGEEYAAEDAWLSTAFIEAAQRDYVCPTSYNGDNPVTMGVDVASVRNLNVRISQHVGGDMKVALFLGEVEDFAALDELMVRYRVNICAIDGQPERRSAAHFAERFAGRVYLINYVASADAPVVPVPDDRRAAVARTEAIDATLADIRLQRNQLPRLLPPDYTRHLQGVVRIVARDAAGRKCPRYHSKGPDDYLHSEVFDWVAWYLLRFETAYVDLVSQSRPVWVPIEEAIPGFVPSNLNSYEDSEYHPGPPERDFDDGYGW